MNMPRLGPGHEKLGAFIGQWEGNEQVAPSPWGPGGPARGRLTFRRDVAGFALILDYVEERAGGTSFLGHGVFCIEPADGSVLWFWFDSVGFPPTEPARGDWEGDTLIVRKTTPRGEGCYRFRLAEGRLHWTIESRMKGQSEVLVLMTGTYERVAGRAASFDVSG